MQFEVKNFKFGKKQYKRHRRFYITGNFLHVDSQNISLVKQAHDFVPRQKGITVSNLIHVK